MGINEVVESLQKNKDHLINIIGQSIDTNYRHIVVPALDNCPALIVNIKGLVDTSELEQFIIHPLMSKTDLSDEGVPNKFEKIKRLMESRLLISEFKQTQSWDEICDAIVSGDTVLFFDDLEMAFILANKGFKIRSVSDPTSEPETRGPKDGFLEDIISNMAMIRRRIRDHSLRFESFKIGNRTKTDIAMVYIESIVNDSLLNEVRTRLNKIDTDAILASTYIEELIEDAPFSIFPKIEHTERPDKASAALIEGRIVILIDNTPFSLILPTVFWNFIQTPGDHYERYFIGSFWRIIRLVALFLAVTSSSIYVLLTSFHQEMLPTSLALKVASGRIGVPFPAVVEAFVMEVLFEIMTEAGLRMPKGLGQTVSIVGTLVIGQGAVMAGLVGPAIVIAVAIGAISSYTIPSLSMSNSMRLLKFPLLFLTALLGIFGFLGGIIVTTLHLISIRSFGTPFYSPVTPFDIGGHKDTFLRFPRWKMSARPWLSRSKDKKRQAADLKPNPNSQ